MEAHLVNSIISARLLVRKKTSLVRESIVLLDVTLKLAALRQLLHVASIGSRSNNHSNLQTELHQSRNENLYFYTYEHGAGVV